jgi:hypothetical protein
VSYCALFMGQFGFMFSQGVYHLARVARSLGVGADVYGYTDGAEAHRAINAQRKKGHKIAGVGYSLGVSTLTELQRRCAFDLVFCIAGSSLGINYPINHENTRRSVLWKGPDILSSAGGDLGFNEVNTTNAWHLFAPSDPPVVASFQRELHKMRDQ